MASLVRNGVILAEVEIADRFLSRLRGLMGRRSIDGAMFIAPASSVHTLFMRFPIDVAFVDKEMRVLKLERMKKWRIGRPVFRAHGVIEAGAGAFARWGLQLGDVLELKA